jgi:serine/threonine-protein kinase RsbW
MSIRSQEAGSMNIWWSLRLRCDAASVALARRMLLGTMESAGVDPDVAFDLSLALSEACANAVEHAAPPADGEAVYEVTACVDAERCSIEVTDRGPGFPARRGRRPAVRAVLARPQSAESGRGLFLIEALMDHVSIDSAPGRGAVVTFDKALGPRTGALAAAS